MLADILPTLAKAEKELLVQGLVKDLERGKKRLSIAISGHAEPWLREWIRKRGHRLSDGPGDLAIFIDEKADLRSAVRQFRHVAAIYPSADALKLPKIISGALDSGSRLSESDVREHGGDERDFFYGLYNAAFFGFDGPAMPERAEFFLVFCLLALMKLLISPSDPFDDLLRHARIHDYGFDYSKLFIYSWNFAANPYLLFDQFAGAMDSAFGHFGLKLIQLLCMLVFVYGFYRHTKGWDQRLRIFVFVMTLVVVGLRITLARPTTFEAFFLIAGLTLSGLPAVLFGLLMGSFYYFFPVYLLPLAWTRREYLASLAIALGGWFYYEGSAYITDIIHLISSIMTSRLIPISENQGIISAIANPFFLVLALMFIKSRNYRYAVPLIFFLLINQVRYIEVIAPLVAVSIVPKALGLERIRLGIVENLAFFAIMAATLGYAFPFYQLADLHISDSRVLCDSTVCMYNVVYYGKNISISPSMEIGMTDRDVQVQIKNMFDNGTLDCGFFRDYAFDKVVENSLKEIPPCLELQGVSGPYRIWSVQQNATR